MLHVCHFFETYHLDDCESAPSYEVVDMNQIYIFIIHLVQVFILALYSKDYFRHIFWLDFNSMKSLRKIKGNEYTQANEVRSIFACLLITQSEPKEG